MGMNAEQTRIIEQFQMMRKSECHRDSCDACAQQNDCVIISAAAIRFASASGEKK